MPFPPIDHNDERVFSNADSFSMAFDTAWKNLVLEETASTPNQQEKLKLDLQKVEDHPFFQKFPSEAQKIAQFRMRLLKLL